MASTTSQEKNSGTKTALRVVSVIPGLVSWCAPQLPAKLGSSAQWSMEYADAMLALLPASPRETMNISPLMGTAIGLRASASINCLKSAFPSLVSRRLTSQLKTAQLLMVVR